MPVPGEIVIVASFTSLVRAMVPVAAGIVIVVVPAAADARRTVDPEVDPEYVTPAPPIVGVTREALVIVGAVPNTRAPDPVLSEITPAS
jgi:hypothetical protein